MKDNYVYPAVFEQEENGVAIFFPDLPGCLPCAETIEEAFKNAKEALQLHLYGMEEDGEEIPAPSNPAEVKCEENQYLVAIEAWMPPFREKMLNKSMNKTVTIPRWLNILAEKEKVNYSHLLQNALKEYLGVKDDAIPHFKQ